MSRLIDADALWMDVIHGMDYCDDILEFIERQPTIEPERKKGRWILHISEEVDGATFSGHRCSVCNYWKAMGSWNFCPNCGTDMRGSDYEG